ncbi:MAG: NERD domain-containing protein [Chloroflexi bacterium]|nr:NERD domain-containing protein [Chloroflexota bacterium]
MQNINPARSIARRGRYYLLFGSVAFFGGAIALTLALLFIYFPLWAGFSFNLLQIALIVIGVVALGFGIFLIVRGLTLQKDNPLAYAVGEALKQFLADNRYTFLRNVSKRRVGYIDAVLVGPPGALVFRIVDYSGVWINERADWVVRQGGKLRGAGTNPTREAVHDVYALRKFLAKRGLEKVPVYAIVVFTSSNIDLSANGPVVPICEIPTLFQIMRRDYLAEERIAPPTVRAAVDAIIDG